MLNEHVNRGLQHMHHMDRAGRTGGWNHHLKKLLLYRRRSKQSDTGVHPWSSRMALGHGLECITTVYMIQSMSG